MWAMKRTDADPIQFPEESSFDWTDSPQYVANFLDWIGQIPYYSVCLEDSSPVAG